MEHCSNTNITQDIGGVKDIEDIVNEENIDYVVLEPELSTGELSNAIDMKSSIIKTHLNSIVEEEEEKQYGDMYNLGEIYGDRFKEAIDENPYYKIDHEFSKKINKTNDLDELIPPFDIAKLDVAKLRSFTLDMINEFNQNKLTVATFNTVNSLIIKKYKTTFRKSDIYYMYCLICRENAQPVNNIIRGIFQSNSYRSQSGVMVYAVFTHPLWKTGENGQFKSFSCKYDCRFCPEQPGHARSYVDGEPGEDRARGVDYDTVKQVYARASSYNICGHQNDKAEVIILGGTWHSYPLEYRRQFVTLLYKAFNTMHGDRDRKALSIEEEMKLNETSKCRVIGLTIETRPDQISLDEILELRRMGVTRVQLGIQHTSDRMLDRVQRGCSSATAINSIKNLKNAGFKVDMHLMPDLPKPFTEQFMKNNKGGLKNAVILKDDIDWKWDSVKEDLKMFDEIFHSTKYCPDQVKIYPCAIMDYTKIKDDFDQGLHVPYGTLEKDQKSNPLIELLINVKSRVPEYVRINRVIRDIPESYILGGIANTNGRQVIERVMKSRGLKCKCVRCREIKKKKIDPRDVKLVVLKYRASEGDEYFLQFVTKDNDIIGFLRLRLSKQSGYYTTIKKSGVNKPRRVVVNELIDTAIIRELHVYGEAVEVNREGKSKVDRSHQHAGYGTKLLQCAFALAYYQGYNKIAVISGEGVKAYYRKFGFVDGEYYLLKELKESEIDGFIFDRLPVLKTIEQNYGCAVNNKFNKVFKLGLIMMLISFIMYYVL
jgi:histone acetyltransferase (RNA polymerase elongator complex component)